MQFSDTTNKNGILQEIDFWILGSSGTASSDYSTADKTRNVNRWLDRVNSLIMQADHRWEWDDTNHTDLPIATTTLVNNQQDYGLDTSHLKIIRVEIKNNAGNYNLILPVILITVGNNLYCCLVISCNSICPSLSNSSKYFQ